MTDTHTNATPDTTTASTCCGDDCCSDASAATTATKPDADAVRDNVGAGYSKSAHAGTLSAGCCGSESDSQGGGCCGPVTLSADQVATAVGYADEDLTTLPEGANMGLSCGNPTAIASLQPGEVVIDLGSGGGFDCFIAGPKVGATGRVIGIDTAPDMLSKARANIDSYRAHSGLDNVEFSLGEIEHIPVADASVDVIISNCVLNLSPDKPRVWQEIARVLRPGGRVAISDLALLQPLPESVRNDVEALIGCVAGADLVENIQRDMAAAGLTDIQLTSKPQYIDAMTNFQDPLYARIIDNLPEGAKPSEYITSLDIAARK